MVACGANSAATAFISPPGSTLGKLVLPDPADTGTYLSCGLQLNINKLPITEHRVLIKP